MATTTHYETLGLSSSATFEEIKAAHRSLALVHHPDRLKGSCTPEQSAISNYIFVTCQRAWEVLKVTDSRARYDEVLSRRAFEDCKSALVDEEIVFADLKFDEANEMYWYPCRCGDRYEMESDDLLDGSFDLECMSCSFSMHLKLAEGDFDEEDEETE